MPTAALRLPAAAIAGGGLPAAADGGVALDGGDCACRRRRLPICTLAEAKRNFKNRKMYYAKPSSPPFPSFPPPSPSPRSHFGPSEIGFNNYRASAYRLDTIVKACLSSIRVVADVKSNFTIIVHVICAIRVGKQFAMKASVTRITIKIATFVLPFCSHIRQGHSRLEKR